MSFIKKWLIDLLSAKFIRDKLAQLIGILNGLLLGNNLITIDQAKSLEEVLVPIGANIALYFLGLVLGIKSTKEGK